MVTSSMRDSARFLNASDTGKLYILFCLQSNRLTNNIINKWRTFIAWFPVRVSPNSQVYVTSGESNLKCKQSGKMIVITFLNKCFVFYYFIKLK